MSDDYHICLTGHRPSKLAGYDLTDPFYGKLRQELAKIVEDQLGKHDSLVLHSGLALGADTIWSRAIIAARKKHPDRIQFVAEVPFPDQPDRWAAPDRAFWGIQVRAADRVNTYAESYSNQALHARNEGMVAASDLLLAVWDGQPGGGTAASVRYATKLDKKIHFLPPDQFRG